MTLLGPYRLEDVYGSWVENANLAALLLAGTQSFAFCEAGSEIEPEQRTEEVFPLCPTIKVGPIPAPGILGFLFICCHSRPLDASKEK